jgi:hypothetical protein
MMKNNRFLAAIIGSMVIFSGTSFAQDQSWGEWLKSLAIQKYKQYTGAEELERKQKAEELGSFLTIKMGRNTDLKIYLGKFLSELSLEESIKALNYLQSFFAGLHVEKINRQAMLQVCNEKIADLTQQQEMMRKQQEMMREQERANLEMMRQQEEANLAKKNKIDEEAYREGERKKAYSKIKARREEEEKRNLQEIEKQRAKKTEQELAELRKKAATKRDVNRINRDSIIYDLHKKDLISLQDRDRLIEFSRNNDRDAVEQVIESAKEAGKDSLVKELTRIKLLMY